MIATSITVSIVMPAYNCARFIAEAIDSVLQQDFAQRENIEVIVVDDGSSDGTPAVVRNYDARVRLIEQRNAGPGAARNRGAADARGEFVAFLDGDDVWLPGKLSAQVAHLRAHADTGVVYGGWAQWHADASGVFPSAQAVAATNNAQTSAGQLDPSQSGRLYAQLLMDCIVWTSCVLMRRDLLQTAGGFNEGLRMGEDYDLWLRLSRQTRIDKLAMTCALYRMHGSNTTRKAAPENFEYRVVSEALQRFGRGEPENGGPVAQCDLDARLAQLSANFAKLHFWNGSPCIAARAFAQAQTHGAASFTDSLKLWLYRLAAHLRCLVAPGAAAQTHLPARPRERA